MHVMQLGIMAALDVCVYKAAKQPDAGDWKLANKGAS